MIRIIPLLFIELRAHIVTSISHDNSKTESCLHSRLQCSFPFKNMAQHNKNKQPILKLGAYSIKLKELQTPFSYSLLIMYLLCSIKFGTTNHVYFRTFNVNTYISIHIVFVLLLSLTFSFCYWRTINYLLCFDSVGNRF